MTGHAALARANFETGCNCAQAVLCAYPELLPRETAMKLGASLGGGIGRLREVCGAVRRTTYSPKDPMNLDAYGFKLQSFLQQVGASYFTAITSAGDVILRRKAVEDLIGIVGLVERADGDGALLELAVLLGPDPEALLRRALQE